MDAAAPFRRVHPEAERRGDEDGGDHPGARPTKCRGGGDGADDRRDREGLRGLLMRSDGRLIDTVHTADVLGGGPSAEERGRGEAAAQNGGDERRRHEIVLPPHDPSREQHRRGDLSEQRRVIQDEMKVGSIHSTTTVIFMLPWPDPQ